MDRVISYFVIISTRVNFTSAFGPALQRVDWVRQVTSQGIMSSKGAMKFLKRYFCSKITIKYTNSKNKKQKILHVFCYIRNTGRKCQAGCFLAIL